MSGHCRAVKKLLTYWAALSLIACSPEQPASARSPAQLPSSIAEANPAEVTVSYTPAPRLPESKRGLAGVDARELDWLELMSKADRERLERGDWMDSTAAQGHPGAEGSFTASMAERQIKGYAAIRDFDGQRVKVAGYFVPLEQGENGAVREILFVPYFGACIHVPPPPANQIIHSILRAPQADVSMFEAYRLEGVLMAQSKRSVLAEAGYGMSDAQLTLWE